MVKWANRVIPAQTRGNQAHPLPETGGNNSPETLEKARQAMEALQLAELDDFFRSACLDTNPVQINSIDQSAAILYPIVLPDKVATIVQIPKKPLQIYSFLWCWQ